jgi:hypothetical protein
MVRLTGLELVNRTLPDEADKIVGPDSLGIVHDDQTASERVEPHPLHAPMVGHDVLNSLGQTVEDLWRLEAQPQATPDRVNGTTLNESLRHLHSWGTPHLSVGINASQRVGRLPTPSDNARIQHEESAKSEPEKVIPGREHALSCDQHSPDAQEKKA